MKIAVIGAGAWGKNHVRNLHKMGCLGAVVESNAELRDAISNECPGVPLYAELNKFILATDCSAVVIATPAVTHFDIAWQVIEAGMDLLVEKPMTLDSKQALKLVEYAKQEERVLMVGHLLLYQPAIQWIKSKLDEGFLGKVFTLHQIRAKLGRARQVENVTWSLGVHDLAVLLYLVDEKPDAVSAAGHCGLQQGVEDDVYVHLDFPSGIKAHLHNSWLWPVNQRALTIVGEKGMLIYDEVKQSVTFHNKTIDLDLNNCDQGEEIVFTGEGQPLALELQHFIDCCKKRETPISDGENGFRVISVLEKTAATV